MPQMPNTIGMSVPGASSLFPPSPASQVQGETEDERKKRLQKLQAARQLPGASQVMGQGYGTALGG